MHTAHLSKVQSTSYNMHTSDWISVVCKILSKYETFPIFDGENRHQKIKIT